MKLALISLLQNNSEGNGPIGLHSLFDDKIVDHQIRLAKSFGAEKILLLSDNMPGALLQHVDMLQQNGDDIQIVRNGKDIAEIAGDEGDMLFLGDGILPSGDMSGVLAGNPSEMILVTENSDRFAAFERVDLEHRWLGVALLKTSRLREMQEIPDDWDFGSALLRTAVQAECHREVISESDVENGQLFALDDAGAIENYVTFQLRDQSGTPRNFVERFATWPLAMWTTRKLEAVPNSGQYLGIATILLGFFAAITAWFEWAIPALCLLIAGQVVMKQLEAMELMSVGRHRGADLGRLGLVAVPAVLLILTVRLSDPNALVPNSVIILALMLNLVVLKLLPKWPRFDVLRPDLALILIIILAGAVFGQIFSGIYAGLTLGSAFLAGWAISKSAKP
ncbi:hypothetical protein SAMN02745824_2618 [Parasphingorhabdus marina DSM 22363]|uniref:Uncharacterized protein n=1 Tax=Parasphingorhabdus marina DSM 22363 TaxID=1123272 RepID=A0A1N6FZV1_9SPHN|nr:hypothetical protein [Parasphingorhabdus marina]SIO00835.1 hypothetical protein SAMN02745824_2618 [Parasphingorhabdus marina DSM 22363]